MDDNMPVTHDPILKKIMDTIPEPRIESTGDVFFDLMSCIIEQQIHYRSTKRIFAKGLERAGLATLTLDNFPVFEEKALSAIKLSDSKYTTLAEAIHFFSTQKVDWQSLDDMAVREILSGIKGIGPWTIDMILLYTLERPDVFPADDFHLKEIMVRLYGLNPASRLKAQMLEVAAGWGANRSMAVRYLLAYKSQGTIQR